MTWLELIRSSMRAAQVLGPGRTPGAAVLADAQMVLNSLLDQWNTEGVNLPTERLDLYTLTSQQQAYTIGPSATDFVTTRPEQIVRANLLLPTSPVIRRPIELIDDREWLRIRYQAIYVYPAKLYNDGAFPNSTLYFHPIPDGAYQVELLTWQLLTQVTELSATLTLPPGYSDAIRYNLAVRIALEWPDGAGKGNISPEVVTLAQQTKAAIQAVNMPSPRLRTEPGLNGRGGGLYNWLDGLVER